MDTAQPHLIDNQATLKDIQETADKDLLIAQTADKDQEAQERDLFMD